MSDWKKFGNIKNKKSINMFKYLRLTLRMFDISHMTSWVANNYLNYSGNQLSIKAYNL